jgi:hypothetical protein
MGLNQLVEANFTTMTNTQPENKSIRWAVTSLPTHQFFRTPKSKKIIKKKEPTDCPDFTLNLCIWQVPWSYDHCE